MNTIKRFYIFAERTGDRLAASAFKDGKNLPGAGDEWRFIEEVDVSRLEEGSGIIGLGHVATILEAVRADGLFLPSGTDLP